MMSKILGFHGLHRLLVVRVSNYILSGGRVKFVLVIFSDPTIPVWKCWRH